MKTDSRHPRLPLAAHETHKITRKGFILPTVPRCSTEPRYPFSCIWCVWWVLMLGSTFAACLQNNPFILQFWMMSEVHQQPKFRSRCVEIIQQLRSVFISEGRHCLDLDNNPLETDEIRFVALPQNLITVDEFELRLRQERYLLKGTRSRNTRGTPAPGSRTLYLCTH
jgi:hypothetical protein